MITLNSLSGYSWISIYLGLVTADLFAVPLISCSEWLCVGACALEGIATTPNLYGLALTGSEDLHQSALIEILRASQTFSMHMSSLDLYL